MKRLDIIKMLIRRRPQPAPTDLNINKQDELLRIKSQFYDDLKVPFNEASV